MGSARMTNKANHRQSPFCDECWQPSLTGQHSDVRSSLNLAAGRMTCLNERCSATSQLLVRCVGFLVLLLGTRQTCRRIIVHAGSGFRRVLSRRRAHFAVLFIRTRPACRGVGVRPLIDVLRDRWSSDHQACPNQSSRQQKSFHGSLPTLLPPARLDMCRRSQEDELKRVRTVDGCLLPL